MPIAILLQSLDTGERSLGAVLELVPPSELDSPRKRRGERRAPLGRMNPVEESKPSPKSSCVSHQLPTCVLILRLRLPDSPPVGGFTINSPSAVLSNLKSGFANARRLELLATDNNPDRIWQFYRDSFWLSKCLYHIQFQVFFRLNSATRKELKFDASYILYQYRSRTLARGGGGFTRLCVLGNYFP